ncbi:MAG: PEGA domain-containing protein [Kiritimatiellae bacterium]|nr:PEGA domain-containing protein [Kiritimatiellia bacterium]
MKKLILGLLFVIALAVSLWIFFHSSVRDDVTLENIREKPYRVALIVENHCTGTPRLPIAALTDTLVALLSGKEITVIPSAKIDINHHAEVLDAEVQNASAAEYPTLPNINGILTASVQEFTSESIGIPIIAYKLKARISLTLSDYATGEVVCGLTESDFSKNYPAEKVKEDNVTLYEKHLHESAAKCTDKFLVSLSRINWHPKNAEYVKVNFTCNIRGADIKIDGLSMGTTPALIAVPKGVHNLRLEYPFCEPYSAKALFSDDKRKWNIVLQLNDKGRMRFHNDTLFSEVIDRIRKDGNTDDYVRRTLEDVTSKFWKNNDKSDGRNNGTEVPKSPSIDQLIEKAKDL